VFVEAIIGDSKVKHGLDRACFWGREKMLIQALLAASVLNIKQLVRRAPVLQDGTAALAGRRVARRIPASWLSSASRTAAPMPRAPARRRSAYARRLGCVTLAA
jgi:hypothetical protein